MWQLEITVKISDKYLAANKDPEFQQQKMQTFWYFNL
jgi:hypothetical protein